MIALSKTIFLLSAGLLLLGYLALSKSGNDGLNPNNPYPFEPERWRTCLASGACKASDMVGGQIVPTPTPMPWQPIPTATPTPQAQTWAVPAWQPVANEPKEIGGWERPDR